MPVPVYVREIGCYKVEESELRTRLEFKVLLTHCATLDNIVDLSES